MSWPRLAPGLLIGLVTTAAVAQPAPQPPDPPPTEVVATATPGPQTPALSPQPPVLQAVGPQAGFGDLLVLGAGARFELVAPPVSEHVPMIDGQPVEMAALAGPWQPGRHAVSLQPAPAPGEQPVPQPALQFVYDNAPPKIQFEIGDTTLLDTYGLDQDVKRRNPPRHTMPERDRRVKILWSPDGRRWIPLLPKDAKPDDKGALADWLTAADRPQVFLWALGTQVFDHGAPIAPKKMQLVRIWAGDELSAVRDLRLRVLPSSGGYQLEMVATDLVGNQSTVSWPLAR